jgi:hypothetical protein
MNERLDDNAALTVYRCIKISLRSIHVNQNYQNIDSLYAGMLKKEAKNANVNRYTVFLLQKIQKMSNPDTTFSMSEYVDIIKNYHNL